jgi:hypothetical protein
MNKVTFDRVLKELRDPVPQTQIDRATARVLQSLETGEPPRLVFAQTDAVEGPPSWRWSALAATVAGFIAVAVLQFFLLQPVDNDGVARTANGRTYRQTERIRARDQAMNLLLVDGSRVEMSPGTALSISWASEGIRIFLSEGEVTVKAAKQRDRHFYVQTKDCEVSVVGTVFSVKAGPQGSHVSVVEGEVEVRQREQKQTLLPGQQVSAGIAGVSTLVEAKIEERRETSERPTRPQESAPPNEPGTLTGRVIRPGTTEGIPGVTVTACADPEGPDLQTEAGQATFARLFNPFEEGRTTLAIRQCEAPPRSTTDEAGRFIIKGLSPGRYAVRAQKSGYIASFGWVPDVGFDILDRTREKWSFEGGPLISVHRFTVSKDSPIPAVSLGLVRTGKISGSVRNTDFRRAVPYTLVQLGVRTDNGGFMSLASVNTNSSGEYRFRVPPGDYVLFAGALSKELPIPIPAGALRISMKEGEELTAQPLPYRDPARR